MQKNVNTRAEANWKEFGLLLVTVVKKYSPKISPVLIIFLFNLNMIK